MRLPPEAGVVSRFAPVDSGSHRRLSGCLGDGWVAKAHSLGAQRGTVEVEDPSAFEDALDDRRREVGAMRVATPGIERLVGGEDQGAPAQGAVVPDLEEQVGG